MDNCEKILSFFANVASILTALVAVFGYVRYECGRSKKRKKLENYLRQEGGQGDKGQRTVTHLSAAVGLTEVDIFEAAFSSKHIKSSVYKDSETGMASRVLFEYTK
jgi:hypothetical protein